MEVLKETQDNKEHIDKPKILNLQQKKNLIAEIKQLRMENEFLKKLNALVLERMKRESAK